MNIYFSCSITGGRNDQHVYQVIVDLLQREGHEVPTAHLASRDLEQLEAALEAEEVYRRDIEWVRACDALIAEVSTPSHGAGYEIAEAVNRGKPVLCLYRQGVRVSKIITGNTEDNMEIHAYKEESQLEKRILNFLQTAG